MEFKLTYFYINYLLLVWFSCHEYCDITVSTKRVHPPSHLFLVLMIHIYCGFATLNILYTYMDLSELFGQ